MSTSAPDIRLPRDLLPADGRFGCGPAKVRAEAIEALAREAGAFMGTSHRQAPVRGMVRRLREGVAALLGLPDGYEVILGNGGTTLFWDAATVGLVAERSQHLVFGEFSGKFADAVEAAPFLAPPERISSEPGTRPEAVASAAVDLYALTHNETSTGVAMPLARPAGANCDALVAVDATSAAGGLRVSAAEVDVYYFAPQKCLASDGGLWIAACSPRALERIALLDRSGRWVPPGLSLSIALDNSRKDQTYNTPALATLFLAVHQIEWILANGGLEWSAGRCDRSARTIYDWAEAATFAQPFVADPADRSHVVATIDLDASVDAPTVSAVLRSNGVVDTDAYRKLGRNQLRVALFPAIDPDDVAALCACVDHVVDRLG